MKSRVTYMIPNRHFIPDVRHGYIPNRNELKLTQSEFMHVNKYISVSYGLTETES